MDDTKMVKVKFAFCKYCQKEVEPAKKPLNSAQKTLWIMIIIGTLGFGIIAWLIYSKVSRKKNYCPTCSSKVAYSKEPFEKPKELAEVLTAKEKVIKKVEKKKSEKVPCFTFLWYGISFSFSRAPGRSKRDSG